jgi:hypothetical protein
MGGRLTQRQETFCVKYFERGNATWAAVAAGYSRRGAAVTGSVNLRRPLIMARLRELRQRAEDEAVVSVLERKRKLSEIVRGRVTDYLGELSGGLPVGKEMVNPGAVERLITRTIVGGDGPRRSGLRKKGDNHSRLRLEEDNHSVVIVMLKMRDPVRAIALLNKMDGVYDEESASNQEMRTVTFRVDREGAPAETAAAEKGTG